jgi:hypothetical protein
MCFSVMYELGFYIPEGGIHHSHRSEYLNSYINWILPEIIPVFYQLSLLNVTWMTE